MTDTRVLVIGATGRQGGAVARRINRSGKVVRALTRHVDRPPARALSSAGIEVVAGDLSDPDSLRRAADGVDVIFAMTVANDRPEDEIAQGSAIVDAARATRTPLLVFSSAAMANSGTGVPSIDAKAEVEARVLAANPRNVVLGPANFYEMVLQEGSLAGLANGSFMDAYPPDLPLPAIGLDDYAIMIDLIIDSASVLPARRVDLACDTITRTEMAQALAIALHRPITYRQLPLQTVEQISRPWHQLIRWMIRTKPWIDTDLPRQIWPTQPWHTFHAWATNMPWATLLPHPTTAARTG